MWLCLVDQRAIQKKTTNMKKLILSMFSGFFFAPMNAGFASPTPSPTPRKPPPHKPAKKVVNQKSRRSSA